MPLYRLPKMPLYRLRPVMKYDLEVLPTPVLAPNLSGMGIFKNALQVIEHPHTRAEKTPS